MKKPILCHQTVFNQSLKVQKVPCNSIDYQSSGFDEAAIETGRYLVIFGDKDGTFKNMKPLFERRLGFKIASIHDFKEKPLNEDMIEDAEVLYYNDLGVALIGGESDDIEFLKSRSSNFEIIPETVVDLPEDYYSSADAKSTWGVSSTNAINSKYSGISVKVAVLDTGFNHSHRDFMGREIKSSSFVPGESNDDYHGHGTHCIGIACGNRDANGLKYGVAHNSNIYSGKVLDMNGKGAQSWLLSGITWAVENGCKVISMSLGSKVKRGQSYDQAYERIAKYARGKGSILVAAAGNDSNRPLSFCPVNSPADCPSVIAIGALDKRLNVGYFSNRATNPGSEINFAAPGVGIYSSWITPKEYNTISGTSMATPFVAGIIALFWEKNPGADPNQIIKELSIFVKKLNLSRDDVGDGLIMAP